MKTIMILLLFLAAGITRADQYTLYGTANYTGVSARAGSEFDGKLGFGAGFSAYFGSNYTGALGLETGAAYVPRSFGYSFECSLDGSGATYTQSYNAVQLPIMAKYWFTDRIALAAGGYLMRGFGDISVDAETSVNQACLEEYRLKKYDYGIATSLGVRFNTNPGMMLELRYNMGIPNLYDGSDPNTTIRMNDFQMNMGIGF